MPLGKLVVDRCCRVVFPPIVEFPPEKLLYSRISPKGEEWLHSGLSPIVEFLPSRYWFGFYIHTTLTV